MNLYQSVFGYLTATHLMEANAWKQHATGALAPYHRHTRFEEAFGVPVLGTKQTNENGIPYDPAAVLTDPDIRRLVKQVEGLCDAGDFTLVGRIRNDPALSRQLDECFPDYAADKAAFWERVQADIRPGAPIQNVDVNFLRLLLTTACDPQSPQALPPHSPFADFTFSAINWFQPVEDDKLRVGFNTARAFCFSGSSGVNPWIDMLSMLCCYYPHVEEVDGVYRFTGRERGTRSFVDFLAAYAHFMGKADSTAAMGVRAFYARSLEDLAVVWAVWYHKNGEDCQACRDRLKEARRAAGRGGVSADTDTVLGDIISAAFLDPAVTALPDDEQAEASLARMADYVAARPTDFDVTRHYSAISMTLRELKALNGGVLPFDEGNEAVRLFLDSPDADESDAEAASTEVTAKEKARTAFNRVVITAFFDKFTDTLRESELVETDVLDTLRLHLRMPESGGTLSERQEAIAQILRLLLIGTHIEKRNGKSPRALVNTINRSLRRCGLTEFRFYEQGDNTYVIHNQFDWALSMSIHAYYTPIRFFEGYLYALRSQDNARKFDAGKPGFGIAATFTTHGQEEPTRAASTTAGQE